MSSTAIEKPTSRITSSRTVEEPNSQPHVSIESVNHEKGDTISAVKEVDATFSTSLDEEGQEAKPDSDEVAGIPELVRNIVSFEDDPTLPVITFRSILLSVLFCVIGSFVSQLS